MAVENNFSPYLEGRIDAISLLGYACANEVSEELKDSIRTFTPFRSGALQESLHTNDVRRIGEDTWESSVSSELYYAKFVEYGTTPHPITPNGEALAFNGVLAERVLHPGASGSHMFQKGASEMKRLKLEAILQKNVALFLQERDGVLKGIAYE